MWFWQYTYCLDSRLEVLSSPLPIRSLKKLIRQFKRNFPKEDHKHSIHWLEWEDP